MFFFLSYCQYEYLLKFKLSYFFWCKLIGAKWQEPWVWNDKQLGYETTSTLGTKQPIYVGYETTWVRNDQVRWLCACVRVCVCLKCCYILGGINVFLDKTLFFNLKIWTLLSEIKNYYLIVYLVLEYSLF